MKRLGEEKDKTDRNREDMSRGNEQVPMHELQIAEHFMRRPGSPVFCKPGDIHKPTTRQQSPSLQST